MFKLLTFCFFVYVASSASIEKNSKISGRIVGGIPARAGQFPFLAGIRITTPTGNYFCSGALVHNQWVLTAAQCANGATLFTIYLGSSTLDVNDPNIVILATETYFLHPDYNPATLDNDIALIKFRSYVTLTDYIKTISLFSAAIIPDEALVITMGWGQTSDNSPGPTENVNYVYLATISNDVCKLTYGSQITDSMVCVAGSYNEGTCLGDSGSPLIQDTASENPYHVGVSSFYSGNGCETPDPSGFTRTHPYVEWIQNTTMFS